MPFSPHGSTVLENPQAGPLISSEIARGTTVSASQLTSILWSNTEARAILKPRYQALQAQAQVPQAYKIAPQASERAIARKPGMPCALLDRSLDRSRVRCLITRSEFLDRPGRSRHCACEHNRAQQYARHKAKQGVDAGRCGITLPSRVARASSTTASTECGVRQYGQMNGQRMTGQLMSIIARSNEILPDICYSHACRIRSHLHDYTLLY